MAVVGPYISIITLNENGFNSIRRHRVAGWIRKARPKYVLPTGDLFHLGKWVDNISQKRDGR